jgi:two-component sensor histidine kinase
MDAPMDAIFTSPPSDPITETHHRFANSLTLLGGLVRMQARAAGRATTPFSNAEIRLMLDGIAARVATVGQLHRMLANVPSDGAVVLNAHLRDIADTLIAAFSTEQQPIDIEHSGSECLTLLRHVQPITLILCEILTNAMKYAHPSGVKLRFTLLCEPLPNGALQMTISDDGVGLPEGFDTAKDGGLGFQIIRTLTAELGAGLDIFSDNLGTTFRLTVPQAVVASAQTA